MSKEKQVAKGKQVADFIIENNRSILSMSICEKKRSLKTILKKNRKRTRFFKTCKERFDRSLHLGRNNLGATFNSNRSTQLETHQFHCPPLEDVELFKYLVRMFDFSKKNETSRLTSVLHTTPDLNIKPQQQLKIMKIFIPSRLTFYVCIYDISYTWIKPTLDSKISNAVRDWMEFPISTSVSEILSLSAN